MNDSEGRLTRPKIISDMSNYYFLMHLSGPES